MRNIQIELKLFLSIKNHSKKSNYLMLLNKLYLTKIEGSETEMLICFNETQHKF